MALTIRQFPCLRDNYGFLVHDDASGETAAIDTPEEGPINEALSRENWRLTQIWNTHWHPDHAGDNLALKKRWGCEIVGPSGERDKIPGIDRAVTGGDVVQLGGHAARVVDAPGHTLGHVMFHFEAEKVAFVGDVIFAMGCGRLFEGTPEQMWASLLKIAAWPDETVLYCAHEYTLANGRFALSVDAENEALRKRMDEVRAARERGEPTVPTRVGAERRTNPFLRAADQDFRAGLGMAGDPPAAAFAEARRRKDAF